MRSETSHSDIFCCSCSVPENWQIYSGRSRPYRDYTPQDTDRAVQLVLGGVSLRKAEFMTGVPITTIRRRLKRCKWRGVLLWSKSKQIIKWRDRTKHSFCGCWVRGGKLREKDPPHCAWNFNTCSCTWMLIDCRLIKARLANT